LDQAVLEQFAVLRPLLVEQSSLAEQQGNLTETAVDALVDAGVARLFLPRKLGGLEVDPSTCAAVTACIARADSAAAWFVMVANSARLLAATWPEALIETLFADDPDTLIAASGNRPLQGVAVKGGYQLNGTNGFVSGCRFAQWFLSPFVVQGKQHMAIMPMSACKIIDNWDAWGMRGTGSNDVSVTNVTVPDSHVVSLAVPRARNRYYSGHLYRCPGRILFATYVPIALVLAEQALQQLETLAQHKTPAGVAAKLRDRSVAQIKYGKAMATYRSAQLYFDDALAQAYARAQAGLTATADDKADLYLAGTHAVQASAQVVRWVADAAGTSVIFERHPLSRIVRDMEMLRHHGFANESRYGSVVRLPLAAEIVAAI